MSQPQSGIQRQHELDALRAFAMLLGIALHGALSFAPGFPWVVQDTKPEAPFIWLFFGIHGFRMALFFLISGYFTMLVWRRRGLASLIKQKIVLAKYKKALQSIYAANHQVKPRHEQNQQPKQAKQPNQTKTTKKQPGSKV